MSIQARNIHKSFGTYRALEGASLEVPEGRLVSLLGPSGSGKTTLLRILAGLDFPDEGKGAQVLFYGEDVTALPAGKRRVGFVFQHYALFRHMTVAGNIAFGLLSKPRPERPTREAIRRRVAELLSLVQLDGLQDRFPSELSGGQRQRVALARALAVNPRVLLLDEPFGALDAKVRKDLRRWLRKFQAELGLTTVFVTHDQEEALELADEVVILNNGKIIQKGSPQEVYDHPVSPFVMEFLGNVNKIAAGASDPRPPGGQSGALYVRPHDVEVLPADAREARDGLRAVVRHVFSAGNSGRISLELLPNHEPFEAEISRQRLLELGLEPGSHVSILFRHVRLFGEGADGQASMP
ncbi:MAG: TOBE-like domain-containing protein [Terrimicrobiaceae bacterium]|nr:TOBE-like domain-containing protein [Terrimicrobiaceae bacterium]